jgi:hypothetical protein
MARLVRNHSTFAEGIERLLVKLCEVEGITTITPGAINPKGGRGPPLIRISRAIVGGFKCTARRHCAVRVRVDRIGSGRL